MSCKSNIYVANTTSTAVVANGTIPIPTIVRRYGSNINSAGSSVTITEPGYYLITADATFTAPVADIVSMAIQQDGTTITGATAATTVTTATTEQRSLAITAIVRVFCGSAPDTITLLNTGGAATYTNVTMSVVKIV